MFNPPEEPWLLLLPKRTEYCWSYQFTKLSKDESIKDGGEPSDWETTLKFLKPDDIKLC